MGLAGGDHHWQASGGLWRLEMGPVEFLSGAPRGLQKEQLEGSRPFPLAEGSSVSVHRDPLLEV